MSFSKILKLQLGAVARSDQHPSGMRTVAGSILMYGNIFSWRFGHEIILCLHH